MKFAAAKGDRFYRRKWQLSPDIIVNRTDKRVRFMSISPNFLRSLLLTSIFSFVTPMLLLGGGLLSVFLLSYFPGLQGMSQAIASALLQFLATFGSGSSFRGLVVIGLTCSLVGALFDTYAFYRYQNLRGE